MDLNGIYQWLARIIRCKCPNDWCWSCLISINIHCIPLPMESNGIQWSNPILGRWFWIGSIHNLRAKLCLNNMAFGWIFSGRSKKSWDVSFQHGLNLLLFLWQFEWGIWSSKAFLDFRICQQKRGRFAFTFFTLETCFGGCNEMGSDMINAYHAGWLLHLMWAQQSSKQYPNQHSWSQNRRQNMAEPQIKRPKVSKLEVVAKCLKYVTHCDTGAFIREWGEQLGWLSIVLMHQSPIPYVKRTLDQRLIHGSCDPVVIPAELPTSPIPSRGAPKCITTAGDA